MSKESRPKKHRHERFKLGHTAAVGPERRNGPPCADCMLDQMKQLVQSAERELGRFRASLSTGIQPAGQQIAGKDRNDADGVENAKELRSQAILKTIFVYLEEIEELAASGQECLGIADEGHQH